MASPHKDVELRFISTFLECDLNCLNGIIGTERKVTDTERERVFSYEIGYTREWMREWIPPEQIAYGLKVAHAQKFGV